jgi:hypothetical protein
MLSISNFACCLNNNFDIPEYLFLRVLFFFILFLFFDLHFNCGLNTQLNPPGYIGIPPVIYIFLFLVIDIQFWFLFIVFNNIYIIYILYFCVMDLLSRAANSAASSADSLVDALVEPDYIKIVGLDGRTHGPYILRSTESGGFGYPFGELKEKTTCDLCFSDFCEMTGKCMTCRQSESTTISCIKKCASSGPGCLIMGYKGMKLCKTCFEIMKECKKCVGRECEECKKTLEEQRRQQYFTYYTSRGEERRIPRGAPVAANDMSPVRRPPPVRQWEQQLHEGRPAQGGKKSISKSRGLRRRKSKSRGLRRRKTKLNHSRKY